MPLRVSFAESSKASAAFSAAAFSAAAATAASTTGAGGGATASTSMASPSAASAVVGNLSSCAPYLDRFFVSAFFSVSEQCSKMSSESGMLMARMILHLTPVWSAESGVVFQKKRMNWTQRTGAKREIACAFNQTASRPSTIEFFVTVPLKPTRRPSCRWSIFTDDVAPPWIMHPSFLTRSDRTTASSASVSEHVRVSSISSPKMSSTFDRCVRESSSCGASPDKSVEYSSSASCCEKPPPRPRCANCGKDERSVCRKSAGGVEDVEESRSRYVDARADARPPAWRLRSRPARSSGTARKHCSVEFM
mmetsp:Transcript_21916/g.75881  ORF Transcript_21916/g.75881 Transcript_21916/m.75881 type:complete len:307 (-) Transcript_21916:431-1351(-)